jgi:hypothetical protein
VRPGPGQLWYDLGFLTFGGVLLAGGWALYRSGLPEPAARPAETKPIRP